MSTTSKIQYDKHPYLEDVLRISKEGNSIGQLTSKMLILEPKKSGEGSKPIGLTKGDLESMIKTMESAPEGRNVEWIIKY